MKPAARRFPHRITWAAFILLLSFAVIYIVRTAPALPPLVASHFDAAGQADAFMTRSGYIRFVLCLAVGLPIVLVAILTAVYSKASDMKLPNRDYWLAPARIAGTRSLLIAHGVWFGSLMAVLGCFVHRLELAANRLQPPHLPGQTVAASLIVFSLATAVWIGSMIFIFRRPPGE